MPEFDVIVVGGGGAGLAAAIEAATLGRRTILLEKESAPGGSTAWSVGSISATNTPHQHAKGIVDHPDAHFEDLDILAGSKRNRDNLVLRRLLVDNSSETLRWLESIGLIFAGPSPEPPHRLPRMHNVLPNSRAFPHALARHCRKLGVEVRTKSEVVQLLTEANRVVGVRIRDQSGAQQDVSARGAVVLAGGDFSANVSLKGELAGPDVATLAAVNPAATGNTIELAREIGATVVNGDIVRGPIMRFIPPRRESLLRRLPPSRPLAKIMRWGMANLPARAVRRFAMGFLTTALGPAKELFEEGAILVNRNGERFCDELDLPGHEVAKQPGNEAFIVLDQTVANRFTRWPHFISTAPGIAYAYLDDYRRNRRDIFHTGKGAADIARKAGINPIVLEQTLNALSDDSRPPHEAPYIALGPVKSYVVFTDGGLMVTERLAVVGSDGEPIQGLFAAGSTGQGGLILEGHGHHLGWAFVSGRVAGRNAALEIAAD